VQPPEVFEEIGRTHRAYKRGAGSISANANGGTGDIGGNTELKADLVV
jgi:hypothetical protein